MTNGSDSSARTLITGASAGIGLELARIFAENGHPLILVARREDQLRRLADELKSNHGVSAEVVGLDLTEPDAPQRLFDRVETSGSPVDVLVNNAGFGSYGRFHQLDIERELRMIQLNVVALTHLTHLFLQSMLARGRGRILNVASTAAFQPGPLMAVYYAGKAFVLSFSEALDEELAETDVRVTTLCPGPTKTEFQATADMEKSRLAQHYLMAARPVAEAGYRGAMQGKRLVIPGILNKLSAQGYRMTPRRLMTKVVRQVQGRSR